MAIGALIGAGATLGAGILGAGAANRAADYNYQMDLLNYYQREQERRDAINMARRQDEETKLGSTDAQGNRTYFKPGVGWVTDMSDDQRALMELYDREETEQLTNDLQKKRGVLNDNVERQGAEGQIANQLRDAFQRIQRADPTELENQMNQASTRGITEGFDSSLQDAMRAAVRTGASNSGKVAASIGAERAKALEAAFMNNKLNSKAQSDDDYTRQQGNMSNLYNMFASRASASPDAAYNPRNIEGMSSQQMGQAQGANQGAMAALINAFAKQGGSMQRIEPNYGAANAVQSGGTALAGAFDVARTDPNRYKEGKGLW